MTCSTTASLLTIEENGVSIPTLQGLSGKTLKIGKWDNPSGVYRLGLKHSSDIYPKPLHQRLEKVSGLIQQFKEQFDIKHHQLLTETQNKEPKDVKLKKDHQAKLDTLQSLHKNYEFPGYHFVNCIHVGLCCVP